MVLKLILIVFFCLHNYSADAKEIEGFVGAQYTKFKDIGTLYDEHGVSARVKYNSFSKQSGMSAMAFLNGGSVLLGDYMIGYGHKTKGKFFIEGAAYGAYSAIWGLGFSLLGAAGLNLGRGFHLSIPLIIRYPAYISISPMIGMRF